MDNLPAIELPEPYNYVGVFLTLGCQLKCSYCLSGNTLILTPYGHKPIKDIEIGDEVIGFEEHTKRMKHHKLYITKVTKKFIREGITQRIITKNSHLDITDEHPILTERGWKPAKNVSKSNQIKFVYNPNLSNKRKMDKLYPMAIPNSDQVIGRETSRIHQTVYNIETESHTYVANGLCVHNCINIQSYKRSELFHQRPAMSAKDWITALNRIEAREDLPLSIQGGEPTSHPYFYEIINGVNRPMDLLTNVQFNVEEFMGKISKHKFKRNAPYASIRVSFHPEQMDLGDTVNRVSALHNAGYQVGVWMVEVPEQMHIFSEAKTQFQQAGIDFRGKELLGEHNGKVYGHYTYEGAVGSDVMRNCLCRTNELLIAPDGSIHRCHSDIYNLRKGIGHVLDEGFKLDRKYRACDVLGSCSGCDLKQKFNRFQKPGHSAVEITNIGDTNETVNSSWGSTWPAQ